MQGHQIATLNLLIVSLLLLGIGTTIIIKKRFILGSLLATLGVVGVILYFILLHIHPHHNPFI